MFLTRNEFVRLAVGAAAASHAPWPRRAIELLPIAEPYAPLHGGAYDGTAVAESFDPLVSYRWSDPRASDDLQIYALRPVAASASVPESFDGLETVATPRCALRVRGAGSLRVDFGVESAAWLEFDSPDCPGGVEMSISEYDEPAVENPLPGSGDPLHPVKTLAPVRYGNTYRLELNPQLYEGVRFGWIHVRSFSGPWHVTAVRAVCQVKPTNYDGSFRASDPALTRIWYTGAYVVKANLCKDYFGSILMDRGDRRSWTGDAHTSQAAALAAFGNWDFIRQNIDRTADDTNGIESYSLYWVLSLFDYYRYTGDARTFARYVEKVTAKLEHAYEIYPDPYISFYGHDERLGATFVHPNCFETKSAYRMLFVRACREFAQTLAAFGDADRARAYERIAAEKMQELRAAGERWYEPFGVHARAEAVNTGLTTPDEREGMYPVEFSDRLNRLSYSPFNQYFILEAMARMGKYDEALTSVRDLWGGQIEYGGTTFFEVYRPCWNDILEKNDPVAHCQVGYTSLAHPWSAGVTKWLSEETLGVKPTTPGFTTFDVFPHLGSTLTSVAGSVPTPKGVIRASFDAAAGRAAVEVPPGTTARIGIPKMGRRIERLAVNGDTVWDTGAAHRSRAAGEFSDDPEYLVLGAVPAGRYEIAIRYRGDVPAAYVPPPYVYPLRFTEEDTTTGGDWGGVYGAEGYVLFNYDGAGRNRVRLPAYVSAVETVQQGEDGSRDLQAASGVTDRRAPAGDARNGSGRNVGYVYTNCPYWNGMSMTVDFRTAPGARYRLALYFLDWEGTGRSQQLELFDLDTLKLMAPVQAVKDFRGGKYLVCEADRPVRLRVNHVEGSNALLTAAFFDPA